MDHKLVGDGRYDVFGERDVCVSCGDVGVHVVWFLLERKVPKCGVELKIGEACIWARLAGGTMKG